MHCFKRLLYLITYSYISISALAVHADDVKCHEFIPGKNAAVDTCSGDQPLNQVVHDLKYLKLQNTPEDLYIGNSTIAGHGLFTHRKLSAGETILQPHGIWARGLKLKNGKLLAWYMDNGQPVVLNENLGQDVLWMYMALPVTNKELGLDDSQSLLGAESLNFGLLNFSTIHYMNDAKFNNKNTQRHFNFSLSRDCDHVSNPNVVFKDDYGDLLDRMGLTEAAIQCLKAQYPPELCGVKAPDFSVLSLNTAWPAVALHDIEPDTELVFDYSGDFACEKGYMGGYHDDPEDYETNLKYYLPLIEQIEKTIKRKLSE